MADNLKISLSAVWSENSDYSDPEWETNWDDEELDPNECVQYAVDALTTGTTLTLSGTVFTAASLPYSPVPNSRL